MENVWDILQKEVPTRIDKLTSSLNTSLTNINAIRALLSSKAQKYVKLDQLDEAMQVMRANKEMLQIENYLNDIIANLNNSVQVESSEIISDITEDDKNALIEGDFDEDVVDEEMADEKTDYSQYLVDKTVPYNLTEDFKNTSPYAFSFDGEKYLVDNWYEITIKVCEILYKKNSRLFCDIVGSCAIKGRKNAYIAFANDYPAKSIGVPKPLLDTNIVVEQRLSANQHMLVVKRLLDKFRITRTAINIYLESDRKPKHGQIPIGKFLNGNIEFYKKTLDSNECERKSDDSPKKKIGQYVRDYFTVYFSDTTRQYDIANFLNKGWCNEHLGICYPLLKEIDETKPVSEQKNYNNEYARYWIKPILTINDKKYIMCSQWFKGFQEKLDKWIESENIGYLKIKQEEKHQRKKEKCVNFDFEKNQCMCTRSGMITMPCNSVNSCEYYSEFSIYVVHSIVKKNKKCPCCRGEIALEVIPCTYQKENGTIIQNYLQTYRCENCQRNYMAKTAFDMYVSNKDMDRLDVHFNIVDKESLLDSIE